MTTNDTTQINQQPKYNFEIKTYNGISVIFESNTGYFNATRMSSDNGRQWRHYKKTKCWTNKVDAFNRFYGEKSSGRNLPHEKISFEPENVANEWRGEYIHPKLIHFVAEWCSDEYAFMVAELMDSINDSVHQRLNDLKLTETPQNANTVFNLIIDEQKDRLVSDNENKQCFGYRERDKFDYLDSWDKSWVKSEFEAFKKHLIDKLSLTFEELKRDYPQLVE